MSGEPSHSQGTSGQKGIVAGKRRKSDVSVKGGALGPDEEGGIVEIQDGGGVGAVDESGVGDIQAYLEKRI